MKNKKIRFSFLGMKFESTDAGVKEIILLLIILIFFVIILK